MGIRLVALAGLLVLLGGLGWNLSLDPEGLKTVGAVKSLEGGREGGTLVVPEGLVAPREEGSGKGTGPDVPASASASSVSVSASTSAGSEPQASGTWVEEPSVSSQASEGSSGSGGQDAGTINPAGGESAAQEQYQQ